MPDNFLTANIDSTTSTLVVVFGAYNFDVVKAFRLPVVGLLNGWHEDFSKLPPFSTMTRGEVVISLVPPVTPPGAQETQPGLADAAKKSADRYVNIGNLRALARDPFMRSRCVLATGGVFRLAQMKYDARGCPVLPLPTDDQPRARTLLEDYLAQFVPLPLTDADITRLCEPPPVVRDTRRPMKRPGESDVPESPATVAMLARMMEQKLRQPNPRPANAPIHYDDPHGCAGWRGQPLDLEIIRTLETDSWK